MPGTAIASWARPAAGTCCVPRRSFVWVVSYSRFDSLPPFARPLLCSALLLGACSDAADRIDLIVITGPTMGATYAVTLYDSNGDTDTDTLQSRADGPSPMGLPR